MVIEFIVSLFNKLFFGKEAILTEETKPAVEYIQPNTFVRLNTDAPEESGVENGQLLFVAGLKALPIDETDPYLQRIFAIVHFVDDDDHVDLEQIGIADPRELEPVDEEEAKLLNNQLGIDFGGE